MKLYSCLCKQRLTQNGAWSIPIGIPIVYISILLSIWKSLSQIRCFTANLRRGRDEFNSIYLHFPLSNTKPMTLFSSAKRSLCGILVYRVLKSHKWRCILRVLITSSFSFTGEDLYHLLSTQNVHILQCCS